MTRLYFLFLYLLACSPILQAQELSVGPELAIPAGKFPVINSFAGITGLTYDLGIGASAKYLYRITPAVGASLQAGGIRYSTGEAEGMSFVAFPVKLGANVRYRSLFAEPQFGFTYFAGNHTLFQSGAPTYGMTAGGYIADRIQLAANYERWNKGGFGAGRFGLRVAYAFTLKPLPVRVIDSTRYQPYRPGYDKTSIYWQQHQTFKALGWVAIGVGVPMTLLGLGTALASIEDSSIKPGTYNWVIGSGLTLTASSIPFFIFSHKYRKMARK